MTLVAYSTAFGSTGAEQPAGLAYIIAISWLTERFETMTNVTGDLTVTAIVANKVNAALVEEAENEDIEGAENVGSVKRSLAAGTENEKEE
jgi:Na+/H+-dicarboxylate symporter